MSWTKTEINEAKTDLRALCPPGTTVYTIIRHVSQSGMQRAIDCYIFPGDYDRRPQWVGRLVAKATNTPWNEKHGGVKVNGCGMDMCYHLVNSLSYALHGYGRDGDEPIPEGFRAGYTLEQHTL